MLIYLVRHGITDACYIKNKDENKDINLNQEGINQIKKLLENFNLNNIKNIITSPTIRTNETGKIINNEINIFEDQRLLNKQINIDWNNDFYLNRSITNTSQTPSTGNYVLYS